MLKKIGLFLASIAPGIFLIGYNIGTGSIVNIPPVAKSECKGFKVTRAGNRLYAHNAEVHHNPRGKEYYWIGLPELGWMETKGHVTDFEAINDGFISITPVHLDMTSYDDIESLGEWI